MSYWKFTVPAPADWINSNQRLHRMQTAALTAKWRQAGREKAEALNWKPISGKVRIVAHIWKARAGRYDPNNLWPTVKAVLDGVVESGLLIDDDHTHVVGPDMRHGGKGQPAIVFELLGIATSGDVRGIIETAPEVLATPPGA